MIYTFRWRCLERAAVLTVTVQAGSDQEAGRWAAELLADFVKGRGRARRWMALAPSVKNEAQTQQP